jgi:hypothetical protein
VAARAAIFFALALAVAGYDAACHPRRLQAPDVMHADLRSVAVMQGKPNNDRINCVTNDLLVVGSYTAAKRILNEFDRTRLEFCEMWRGALIFILFRSPAWTLEATNVTISGDLFQRWHRWRHAPELEASAGFSALALLGSLGPLGP